MDGKKISRQIIRTEEVIVCPICASHKKTPLYEDLEDRLFGSLGTWTLKRCNGCGLFFLDPRPIPEDIGEAYRLYYTHETEQVDSFSELNKVPSFIFLLSRGVYRFLTSSIRKKRLEIFQMFLTAKDKGLLLDVGCGDGRFLSFMQNIGWKIQGVESDSKSAKVAEDKLGIPIFVGNLQQARFEENTFDAITLSHVIEHLYDPIDVLSECFRILKPGGELIAVTPNGMSLGHTWFGKNWRGLEVPRHIQIFSRLSLKKCAEESGFKNIRVFSSAARAEYPFYFESLKIKNYPKQYDEWNMTFSQRVRCLTFSVIENLLIILQPQIGEELVLKAIK